ncbi:MAG: hypothetical protein PUB69_04820 [Desulfovibrionaceae bacterium]|nr:hypothetical protein [Desulfovibrionaceae bacterium]
MNDKEKKSREQIKADDPARFAFLHENFENLEAVAAQGAQLLNREPIKSMAKFGQLNDLIIRRVCELNDIETENVRDTRPLIEKMEAQGAIPADIAECMLILRKAKIRAAQGTPNKGEMARVALEVALREAGWLARKDIQIVRGKAHWMFPVMLYISIILFVFQYTAMKVVDPLSAAGTFIFGAYCLIMHMKKEEQRMPVGENLRKKGRALFNV